MNLYQVSVPTPLSQTFTYACDKDLKVGQLVIVQFRTTLLIGVILGKETTYAGAVKGIEEVLPFSFNKQQMDFLRWMSQYTLTPFGLCLKLMIPLSIPEIRKMLKKPVGVIDQTIKRLKKINLTDDQQDAVTFIKEKLHSFAPILLDGMTGSGKTEVYFDLIHHLLDKKAQILILLPEIALTEQWLQRFNDRFGFKPLLWHSQTTPKNRRQIYETIYKEQSCVVVGARSALFLPFQNLQLIVVDEEHDSSYKQEEQVIYNARDAAIVRAQYDQCPVILSSATPSLESYYNAKIGKYFLCPLKTRYGVDHLPEIFIVNRRKQKNYISDPLKSALQLALTNQQQSLLFLNRRGFAPLTLCSECGYRFECPSCSAWLIHHEKNNQLKCHHCNHAQLYPEFCPDCGTKESLIPCGPGVERLHEEAKTLFPDARFLVMSSDLVDTPTKLTSAINQILNHEVDIIIGTQLMTKGHHFERLTTVGVIDADMGLNGMDLRACEKTFQMLFQVAGRAGRSTLKGQIYIQTYNPEHPVIQNLRTYNKDAFFDAELKQREAFHMPPFSKMATVTLSARNQNDLNKASRLLTLLKPKDQHIQILGPSIPPLAKVKNTYRQRFLMITEKSINRQQILHQWVLCAKIPKSVRIHIDIDPV